jgi:hypothetical protein
MAIFGGIGKRLGLGSAESLVTRVTGSPLAGAIAGEVSEGISGLGRGLTTQQGQNVAIDRSPEPPAETKSSGERGPAANGARAGGATFIQASYGGNVPAMPQMGGATTAGLPAIVGGGTAIARGMGGIAGMLGIAGGAIAVAPIIIDPFTGEEKKLRVTRRLKSQVKKAVEMFGIEFVADAMGTDVEVVVYILTKRMRNDGPYVTKAAVRKTRQTVRKMKNLCDMYDDLRPAARRRAPARKTMSTRITNVK